MALFEFNRSFGPVPGVGQLSFEHAAGQICARDSDGNLVMRIATGPGFGQRLAMAFSDYRETLQEANRQRYGYQRAATEPDSSAGQRQLGDVGALKAFG